jgi:hypothetical protein
VKIYDARFSYPSQRPIPPSGILEIDTEDPSKCTGAVKAAIFADGHVEGGSEELRQLFDRRAGAYSALVYTIPLLNAVATNQQSIQDVINKLNSRLEEARKNFTPKGAGEAFVCVIVMDLLKSGRGLHVPSDNTPNRAPKVEDVMNAKGVSRDQARAIVLAQNLQEWRAALEGHLDVPAH